MNEVPNEEGFFTVDLGDHTIRVRRPTPEEIEAKKRWEEEQKEHEWKVCLKEMNVPRRYWKVSLSTSRETAALTAVRAYLQHDYRAGRCLILCGPTGCGKTHAVIAGLLETFRPGSVHGRFWYFPTLSSALLDFDRRDGALSEATSTRFAVWDDFGTEYVKPGGLLEASIDELIWHREANRLPMLITTNLTPDQMRERLSDRILDRLRGDWGSIHLCNGPSLRQKADGDQVELQQTQ